MWCYLSNSWYMEIGAPLPPSMTTPQSLLCTGCSPARKTSCASSHPPSYMLPILKGPAQAHSFKMPSSLCWGPFSNSQES